MKAAAGSPKTGDEILGRKQEINNIYNKLEGHSILFTAERRVGKSCLLRKMEENPQNNWDIVLVLIESCHHPAECVERIYNQIKEKNISLSFETECKKIFEAVCNVAQGSEYCGFSLPQFKTDWKKLLEEIISCIAKTSERNIAIVLDELPHMLNNFIAHKDHLLAAEFLDTIRELRQKYQASGKVRMILAGSIGLHLVIKMLKQKYGYTGNPINDMTHESLSGMSDDDVELLCNKYLSEEGIKYNEPEKFLKQMRLSTDSMPYLIGKICESFQLQNLKEVNASNIKREVNLILEDPQSNWFREAAERIDTHYSGLGMDIMATELLNFLSQKKGVVLEADIVSHLSGIMTIEHPRKVQNLLELLLEDHYLLRVRKDNKRGYKFQYEIMRRWWKRNRG